ncbi:MAG: FAD-dependent oxidoreductase [Clostridia bacterium]|nr:FAD-dependent oxidoreductase [Clostridia bacterium]
MDVIKTERTVTKKGSFDVIVVGGGIAGVSAAVSAARAGVTALLIEKSINLGGLATGGLISWYEPLCDGKGQKMMCGMAEELIRLSCRYGFDNLPTAWDGDGRNKQRNERYSTFYSPGIFSAALDSFVTDSGAQLRFDTLATYPVMNGAHCEGVVVESADGCEFFEGKLVIDATGDASVMHRAGVPTVDGKNYMTYISHWFTHDDAKKLAEDGDICAFRRWLNAGSDMLGNGHPEGMKQVSGTTADEITEYVITGKKRMLERVAELDKNSFDIMMIPTMPQFRTVRRIVGNTEFCAVDGQEFSDSIGACGDFRPSGIGKHYQVPFGALWNNSFPNLLAAGRIISAPAGDGWEVSRVIPVCALTGEAAGKAAALCVKASKTLDKLNAADIEAIRVN